MPCSSSPLGDLKALEVGGVTAPWPQQSAFARYLEAGEGAMGQKKTKWGTTDGSIFPLTNVGFLGYPLFLTWSQRTCDFLWLLRVPVVFVFLPGGSCLKITNPYGEISGRPGRCFHSARPAGVWPWAVWFLVWRICSLGRSLRVFSMKAATVSYR